MGGSWADPRVMAENRYEMLKARAVAAGMSLPDYLLAEYRKTKPKVSEEELWRRIRSREPIRGVSGAELVRKAREERGRQIEERLDRLDSRR